jgi:hypothetical protein
MAPEYFSTKISTCSKIHDRETRNMNDLDVPIFKTNSGQRTFKFKDISNLITFEKQLKQNMLSNIFA